MKTLRRLIVIYLLSLAIAIGFFFINNTKLIASGTKEKVFEILFISIPVFIIVTLLYFINRAVVKAVRGIKIKKPSS